MKRLLALAAILAVLCARASATVLYITTYSPQTGANWIYGWDVDANNGQGQCLYQRDLTFDTLGNSPLELPLAIWSSVRTTGRYAYNPGPPETGYGHEYSFDLATKTPGPAPDGDLHYPNTDFDITDGTAVEAVLPTISPNLARYNYSFRQRLIPGDRHTEIWVFDENWGNGQALFRTAKNIVLNGITYDYRNYDGSHPYGAIWGNSDNGSNVYRFDLDYGPGLPIAAPTANFVVRNSQFGLAFDPQTNFIWTHTGSNLYGWTTSGVQMSSQTATGIGGVPLVGDIFGMEMQPVILEQPTLASEPGAGINFGPVLVPNAALVPGGTTLTQPLYGLVLGTGSLNGITFPGVTDTVHFSPSTTDPNPPTPGGPYVVPAGGSQPRSYSYTPTIRTGYDGLGEPIYDEDGGHVLYSDDGAGNVQEVPISFRGRGVAPISSTSTLAAITRVGTPSTLANSATLTMTNLGDGNLDTRWDPLTQSNLIVNSVPLADPPGGMFNLAPGSPTTFSLYDYGTVDDFGNPLDRQTVSFTYTPTPGLGRGNTESQGGLIVHFDDGSPDGLNQAHDATYSLAGIIVGPVYNSVVAPNTTIDFGDVVLGYDNYEDLLINNVSPDGDLGQLTDLSLLSYAITGPDAALFSVTNWVPGTVIAVGGPVVDVELRFEALGSYGIKTATLEIRTDEEAPFGAPGTIFYYPLRGNVTELIPEPGTLTLLALGGLGLLYRRRRRQKRAK